MSNTRRHLRNAGALVFSGGAAKLLMFVATVQVLKKLRVEHNGVFQLAYTLGYLYSILTEMGLRGFAQRKLARIRDDHDAAKRLFSHVILTRLLAAAAGLPILGTLLFAAGYSRMVIMYALALTAWGVLDSFAVLLKYALRAFERMHYEAVFSILGRLILVLAITSLTFTNRLNLTTLTLSYIGSAALEVIGLLIAGHAVFSMSVTSFPRWEDFRNLVVCSFPFAVVNLVGILYIKTGTLLLSKMLGDLGVQSVAYFTTAAKLPEAIVFLPLAIVNAIIPFLSRNAHDLPLVKRYAAFLVRYVGFAAAGSSVILIMEAEFIIRFISKPEYLVAIDTFRLYGAWSGVVFLHHVFANTLIAINDEKYVMKRYLVTLCINILLNLALIPLIGVTGAALSLFLTESVAVVFDGWRTNQRGISISMGTLAQIAFVGLSMTGILMVLSRTSPFLRIPIACLTGGVIVMAVFWTLDREAFATVKAEKASA